MGRYTRARGTQEQVAASGLGGSSSGKDDPHGALLGWHMIAPSERNPGTATSKRDHGQPTKSWRRTGHTRRNPADSFPIIPTTYMILRCSQIHQRRFRRDSIENTRSRCDLNIFPKVFFGNADKGKIE